MALLIMALAYFVLGAFLGVFFLAWRAQRRQARLPEGQVLEREHRTPLGFALVTLVVMAALGFGSEFNGFEVGFFDRLWMTAFGFPFLLFFLLLCNEFLRKVLNRRIRSSGGRYV